MAQSGVQLEEESLHCLICMNPLRDPVTTPCGHSYCTSCITSHWDEEHGKRSYSCPRCRQTFTTRPRLLKNTTLAALVEQMKKMKLQADPADLCYAGDQDVACDSCTGRKLKALKSCLVCRVSFCEKHLHPHFESAPFEKHELVEPSRKLLRRLDIQQRIQHREEELQELQQEVKAISSSAGEAVQNSQKILTDLIHLMERRRSELEQQVRSQQEAEVRRVKELQEELEQEIRELKRSNTEQEEISDTKATHSSSMDVRPRRHFGVVTAAVSELREKLEAALTDGWTKISLAVTQADVLLNPRPEPTTRAGFLRYAQEITLDPNTANAGLLLSEGNRKAARVMEDHLPADHPETFTFWPQVLSTAALRGRCYWEVKWSGKGVAIAVTYGNIGRVGRTDDCMFGFNHNSWALYCSPNQWHFWHNKVETAISGPRFSTVGVYVDHTAGVLSFYGVSETMTLLHRVHTSFTQPLHAGLHPCIYGSTAEIINLNESAAV